MNEEERLKERIYKVVPSCSLHMMELLSIMEIKITSEISSAAVTIENRPTLLINKDFVDTYCKTDEHLLMLIMHELYHIILGHTRLFDCHSDIDNIALDAIINALLCRSFKDSDYTSFFTNINSDDKFPNCLLRPIGKNTPKKYIPFLNTLYNTEYGTYFEAYELIINNLKEGLINGDFILIGDHSKNGSSISNPIMKELLDKVISKWPRELVIRGRDLGGKLVDEKTTLEKIDKVKEKKMLKLLKESGVIDGNIISNKYRCNYIKTNALTFNPNYKDRTILSKTILYNNPILYNNEVTNYSFARGGIGYYAFYVLAFILLIDTLCFYIYVRVKGGMLKFFPIWFFLLPMVVAAVVQFFLPDISTIWIGAALTVDFLFMALQNDTLFRDKLTKLYNRMFLDLLKTVMEKASKSKDFTAMMLDLNGFKHINDEFGHAVGDEALVVTGELLREAVGPYGAVIRFAGDEFIIILNTQSDQIIERVVMGIEAIFKKFNKEKRAKYKLSISLGYSKVDIKNSSIDDIMKEIDEKMYLDKQEKHKQHPEWDR